MIKSIALSISLIFILTGCETDKNKLQWKEEDKEQQDLLIGSCWDNVYLTMSHHYEYRLTFRPDKTGQWSYTDTYFTDDYEPGMWVEEYYSVDFAYDFTSDNKLKISAKDEYGEINESLWVYRINMHKTSTGSQIWQDPNIEISFYSGNRYTLKDDISKFELEYNQYYNNS